MGKLGEIREKWGKVWENMVKRGKYGEIWGEMGFTHFDMFTYITDMDHE